MNISILSVNLKGRQSNEFASFPSKYSGASIIMSSSLSIDENLGNIYPVSIGTLLYIDYILYIIFSGLLFVNYLLAQQAQNK